MVGKHTGKQIPADEPESFQKEFDMVCVLVSNDINCIMLVVFGSGY